MNSYIRFVLKDALKYYVNKNTSAPEKDLKMAASLHGSLDTYLKIDYKGIQSTLRYIKELGCKASTVNVNGEESTQYEFDDRHEEMFFRDNDSIRCISYDSIRKGFSDDTDGFVIKDEKGEKVTLKFMMLTTLSIEL